MPTTDDEIREKYLERAIRELNQLTRELQECPHCPRGKLMPVLGSGHPQADVFMLKHAPAVVGDRGGRRLLRARRQRADEELQTPGDRPAGRLRHALRQVPDRRARPRRRGVRAAAGRGDRDRAAEDRRGDGGAGAAHPQRARSCRSRGRSSSARGRSRPSPRPSTPSMCPTSMTRWMRRAPSSASGGPSGCSGDWYEDLPPY